MIEEKRFIFCHDLKYMKYQELSKTLLDLYKEKNDIDLICSYVMYEIREPEKLNKISIGV